MTLVLDAAVVLAWRFKRADPEEALLAEKVLSELLTGDALVPVFWYAEVANGALTGERLGVVQAADTSYYLNELAHALIFMDEEMPLVHQADVLSLARCHGLSVHEATYLELAMRSSAVLAAFGGKLATAARACGVRVFGDAEPEKTPEVAA
jgi:predicted nucleic acid-binding protein